MFAVEVTAAASTPVVAVVYRELLFPVKAAFDRVIVAPLTVRSSPTVTAESESEIAPDRESVVMPERAPAVETSNAVESSEKLSPLSPRSICPLASRAPLAVKVPETVRELEAVVASESVIEEEPESMTMFPVSEVPRVRVCIAVVDNVPVALRYDPPAAPADSVAVGVPEFTFRIANLAEDEACPPIAKSTVELFANNTPEP